MRTKRSTRAAVVRVLKSMRDPRRQVNAVVRLPKCSVPFFPLKGLTDV